MQAGKFEDGDSASSEPVSTVTDSELNNNLPRAHGFTAVWAPP